MLNTSPLSFNRLVFSMSVSWFHTYPSVAPTVRLKGTSVENNQNQQLSQDLF